MDPPIKKWNPQKLIIVALPTKPWNPQKLKKENGTPNRQLGTSQNKTVDPPMDLPKKHERTYLGEFPVNNDWRAHLHAYFCIWIFFSQGSPITKMKEIDENPIFINFDYKLQTKLCIWYVLEYLEVFTIMISIKV